MVQQDTLPIKEKIMDFIKKNGPSLPAHVANEVGQSILFASAFLAELLSEKKLILSDMKVGSSPVYFIAGQESLLERYSVHIKGKPGEAYKLLKEKKYLKDSEQLPAIRVALRSIKDFAKPFRFKDEIYWRYLTEDVDNFLKLKNEVRGIEDNKNIINSKEVSSKKKLIEKSLDENIESKEKTIDDISVLKDEDKEKKLDIFDKKDNILFITKIRDYFKRENITVLEETDIKKREFLGRGRIQSDIGEIEILIIGRDKKNIIERDIERAMEEAVNKKMFVLFLSTGNIVKKVKDFYRDYRNLIRVVNI